MHTLMNDMQNTYTFHAFPIGRYTLFCCTYLYSIAVLDSGCSYNFKVTNKVTNNEHHYYETRLKLKYRKKSIDIPNENGLLSFMIDT